ncbi:MAG: hypothetical protein WBX01_09175 [Nitrososphaeraceae archaeon]
MLGDLIGEGKGKLTGQRILEIHGEIAPRLEMSVSGEGKTKGNIEYTEMWTYWSERGQDGTQYGEGNGLWMTKDGNEVVTMTGQGVARMTDSGSIRYVGSNFYSTTSTGKLAFLNNVVGIFEYEVDKEFNYRNKIWEWK